MKRILFVAPASIPLTGAEAICNVKLLKALQQEGYAIDLISRQFKYKVYPPSEAEELGLHMESINVITVDNRFTFTVLLQHILTFLTFGFVFKGSHWAYEALKVARRLCKQNHYDAIITKNFPSELVGWYIKRHYGLRWIATWNDPYPQEKYPAPYGNGADAPLHILKRPLIKAMQEADVHIFPNERLCRFMRQYLTIRDEQVAIVPHIVAGEASKPRNDKAQDDKVLRLIHTGYLLPPRDARTCIEALSRFVKKQEEAGHEPSLRFTFQGVMPEEVEKMVQTSGLSRYVSILPPTTYEASQQTMMEHDMLVIIEAPCAEGIFLPTKVSEAMQAGIPIFAISPAEGILHDLHQEGNVAYFACVNDVDSIEQAIAQAYADHQRGSLLLARVKEEYKECRVVEQYNAMINS